MKVCDLLKRQQNNTQNYIADNDGAIQYAEWHARSIEVSKKIQEMQIHNECVVLFLPNSIQYAVAYFGIAYSKNVIVPLDIRARQPEIESTIRYCESKLIITVTRYQAFLKEVLHQYPHTVSAYMIDRDEIIMLCGLETHVESSGYDFATEDVLLMLHTSGTTSNPKRIMLTNENLISNVESNIASLQFTQDDVTLIMLPMCFGYCNTAQFLTHAYLGADIVIYNAVFFAKEFFEMIKIHHITNFTAVPYMLHKLLAYRHKSGIEYPNLRYICFGGSKTDPDTLRLLIEKYPGTGFVHTYGQTECSPRLTALMPQDSLRKIGSVGKPIPGVHVIVRTPDGTVAAPMVVGEILAQGKNIMKGYYKQEAITKKNLVDGWLHTGDLGYFDHEGYLYITGRIKNMIISGGQNLYPEEIEEIILTHHSVKEVYVYAKSHALLGEVPVADVVMSDTVKVGELPVYLEKRLAKHKIPVEFNVVESLEKTYNGKIKRSNLKNRI
jgi:long-chain acyl-CoA synthetase